MSILSGLQSDPVGTLILLLYRAPAVLIALTLHELSHGYVALRCGDPTAKMLGRLTFNPLKHLDPIGTVFMFLFGFGWARPVPVNPRNYKHFRRDDLLVSLAGVTMNFLLFVFATLLMVGVNELLWTAETWTLGDLTARQDFLRFDGWNFRSIYSGMNDLFIRTASGGGAYYLEGLYPYLKTPWLLYVQRFLMNFTSINLSLAIFNLLPIPPLDGYHVVNDIFLRGKLHIPARAMNTIMIGLMVVFYATHFLSDWLGQAVYWVQGGVVSGVLAIFGLG